MRKSIGLVVTASLALALALPAFADRPKVAKASPDNGDTDVDPATKELRIEFDQPMNHGGMSVVGGGEKFPKIAGKPRWADDHTFVVPIQLQPDHDYWLSINSDRFQNFRGQTGQPAEPYPISFKTRKAGGAGDAKAKPLAPEQNRKAIAELRRAIREDYSYRDRLKLDWDALFKAATPKLEAATTPAEFARAAALLLAEAKDLHLWLDVDGIVVATHRRSVAPNLNLATLMRAVPGWAQRGTGVYTGRFADGTGYVLIDSWSPNRAGGVKAALAFLAGLKDAPGYVIDVRANAGGDEALAQAFAGCFVEEPGVYSKHRTMNAGQLLPPRDRVLQPAEPKLRGKAAVLMGRANMSSCESFLLMMKQAPGCVLVGERSYGSSGNPHPFALGNGVTAYIPSWQDLLPDGSPLEGVGVKPDIEVAASPAEFRDADPVLNAALAALRSGAKPAAK